MSRPRAVVAAAAGLAAFFALCGAHPPAAFDVVIRGGRVLDGTGNPWSYADVGIRDGRIAALGRLSGAAARQTVDARGKIVAPGFIDLHSHADGDGAAPRGTLRDEDPRRRAAPNLVSQGITTVVVNPDGRGCWPIAGQVQALRARGIGVNAVLLVGHGTLRARVLGEDFRRSARPDEVARMRALLRQGLQEGAWGLSAGLEYPPGRWSTLDELVALAEEVARAGGVYIAHQRSEGSDPLWYWPSRDGPTAPTLLDAVRETIAIGERTGATVVASHLKAKGAHYWGHGRSAIQLIEEARARGVSIWADQYPYDTTGSDGDTVLIPEWAFGDAERGPAAPRDYAALLEAALADPGTAARVRRDVAHEISRRGGADRIVVFEHPDPARVGRSLAALATERGTAPVEMALALQREGDRRRPGGARLRGFSLSEEDIDAYAAQPWTATATDAGLALPGDGPVHARFYGTFPRKLRRYALERRVLSVADAVRSATSLPAQILGLRDRGLVREGCRADLVVLDLERLRDAATFTDPHRRSEGVDAVLVGGRFVVRAGALTGELPGEVLTLDKAGRGR